MIRVRRISKFNHQEEAIRIMYLISGEEAYIYRNHPWRQRLAAGITSRRSWNSLPLPVLPLCLYPFAFWPKSGLRPAFLILLGTN
ncbi:MAG: hypothetical protein C4520_17550 [Candidatus Abyssobacteria bacterium SURF_5]|uniref:Uncharacterized protein n=1 Tax=Abyssobacteria bacterium (strain SURF_5) TaxID=2093360 RepID=A0A3A4NFC8_ABYX5|nr:MAG: hypothetical protein C4520_17550 [Candidatus Abyssubacteria bacterium SURF_5]